MALPKIQPADYATKGIRVKPNPLGLSVSDAQRAFDELSLDVIIPKINEISDAQDRINETLQPKEAGKGLSKNDFTDTYKESLDNLQDNLDKKVDNVVGKGLSTNDYTDEDKAKLNDVVGVSDVLTKTNTTPYTPTEDYNPATKKYVQDNVIAGGIPATRKINGYTLDNDVNLHGNDIKFIDDTTSKVFVLGVDNGGLYYKEVVS